MALQGTIDAFPLVDVLQLLSVSHKSGRLVIEGDRGTGDLWVREGGLVAGSAPGADPQDPVGIVFEVLRFGEGSFLFEPGATPGQEVFACLDITDLLTGAGALLEEWNRIVEVVPSQAHLVRPVGELPEEEVTLSRDDWAVIVATRHGMDMATLAEELGLGELEAARRVAGLVERSLMAVEEPPAPDLLPVLAEPARSEDSTDVPEARELDGRPEGDSGVDLLGDRDADDEVFPERFPIDDLIGGDDEADWAGGEDGTDVRSDRYAAFAADEGLGAFDGTEPSDQAFSGTAFTDSAFSDSAFSDSSFSDSAFSDSAFSDPALDDQAFSDPAFGDQAFGDSAFGDSAFSDPAFGDSAFSDPAFGDSASIDASTDPAFTAPAFTDPPSASGAFSASGFSDPALAAQGSTEAGSRIGADPLSTPGAEPDGTDEVLRQMSRLSPKAAEAIAAALGTAAEPDGEGEPSEDGGSSFLQSL